MKTTLLVLFLACLAPLTTYATETSSPDTSMMKENVTQKNYTLFLLTRDHKSENADIVVNAPNWSKAFESQIEIVKCDLTTESGKAQAQKLKLDPEIVPTPLALIVSKEGVVTGTYRRAPHTQNLQKSILPPAPLAVRKALSEGKSVWISVYGKDQEIRRHNHDLIQKNIKDEKTVCIEIDGADSQNNVFLQTIKVPLTQGEEAQALLMKPPMNISVSPIRGKLKDQHFKPKDCGPADCGPGG